MKAWLITREWFGDHAEPENGKIVCILNPRLSPERVRSILEQLYVMEFGSLSEQMAYAKNTKSWPYPPQFGSNKTKSGKTVGWRYTITCGHNPWFHARPVKNVVAVQQSNDSEALKWDEIEKPLCVDI